MEKVFQTDMSENGNCLQACLASLFCVPLDFIPEFNHKATEWRKPYVNFLSSIDIEVVFIPVFGNLYLQSFLTSNAHLEGNCILSVRSFQHPNRNHAVIGRLGNGQLHILHDPNKANADRPFEDYEIFTIHLFNHNDTDE